MNWSRSQGYAAVTHDISPINLFNNVTTANKDKTKNCFTIGQIIASDIYLIKTKNNPFNNDYFVILSFAFNKNTFMCTN